MYIFRIFVSLLSIFIICTYVFCFAQTPGRWRDGKIEFAIAKVGNDYAFNEDDKTFLITSSPTAIVSLIVPNKDEINLSTCALRFYNWSDFNNSLNSKKILKEKIRDLRGQISNSDDFPKSETKDELERLDWLKSYYNSLTK